MKRMKKTSFVVSFLALAALMSGGIAHAEISTSASAAAAAAALKDPVAQKLMEVRNRLEVSRMSCEKLTGSDQKNCFDKNAVELKKAEDEVKKMFKLSDDDFARKMKMSAEARGEIKANMGERMKDDDSKKTEDRRGMAKQGFENVIKELRALLTRFTSIADRIEARIKIVNSKGADTTQAEKYLSAARNDLNAAKGHIETAGNRFQKENDSVATSTISRTRDNAAFANTKASIKAAKESLRSAHKNFGEALKALRSVDPGDKQIPVTDASVDARANGIVNVQ